MKFLLFFETAAGCIVEQLFATRDEAENRLSELLVQLGRPKDYTIVQVGKGVEAH